MIFAMAVRKLSSNIQCLFSSSVHIFSYKRAIEELVFNALDAQSTSIAIRLHIQENKIQVVDNGNGIGKENFELLGQNYATTKFVDLSKYKSAPNSYGFRGQSLAGLVDVSKCVKITSRVMTTEETWTKTFYRGKGKEATQTTSRPSKGTTVEVNGFLYNLNIQNKGINPVIEMNEIKTLLEQLSLVHNNVSFSLRDDSKNEIVFKAHKNSDIYQTLKSLFDIEKSDIQELQVEKNEYKVTAYVAKNNDHPDCHHWIYLNKKIVNSTKLQKLIHENLSNTLNPTRRMTKLKKSKLTNNVEGNEITKNHVSFYFIFVTCPYYDYDISNTPRQSTLEFKDWNQITKIVEKLVKFYAGDLVLREVKKTDKLLNKNNLQNKNEIDETRQQVKEIMKKILGSNPKKGGVSQMQNGVKGKLIKRKNKKIPKLSLSKVVLSKEPMTKKFAKENDIFIEQNHFNEQDAYVTKKAKTLHKTPNIRKIKNSTKIPLGHSKISKITKHKPKKSNKVDKKKTIKKKCIKDPLIEVFKKQPDIVVERCNLLAEKVECLLPNNNDRKQTVFINETVNYSNVVRDNKNISTRQRVEEMIIYDYIPLNAKEKNLKIMNHNNFGNNKIESMKTSYDLLKTIVENETTDTQNLLPFYQFENIQERNPDPRPRYETEIPQLTYQSHHYISNQTVSHHHKRIKNVKHFIDHKKERYDVLPQNYDAFYNKIMTTKNKLNENKLNESYLNVKDNTKLKPNKKQIRAESKLPLKQFNIRSFSDNFSSHTIEFSNSKENKEFYRSNFSPIDTNRTYDIPITNVLPQSTYAVVTSTIGLTYTITNSSGVASNFKDNLQQVKVSSGSTSRLTYRTTEEVFENHNNSQNEKLNVIFISNSNDENSNNFMNIIEPLNVCETILNSSNVTEATNNVLNDNKLNDSLFNFTLREFSSDVTNCDVLGDTQQLFQTSQNQSIQPAIDNQEVIDKANENDIDVNEKQAETNIIDENYDLNEFIRNTEEAEEKETTKAVFGNDFDIRYRPRFLPKGMSPIFENRCVKTKADSINVESGYFADELYNKFRDEVQTNTEVYEAPAQNPTDFVSKNIVKVNKRLEKDNSALIFNAQSLSEAEVLGQVDNKFIATVIKGKSQESEFLVLFDQHAVHERIRLEENLAEYFVDNGWSMVRLDDDILLKLSTEEIIYLHNYKEKFIQLGLDWTILNNSGINLHGIPTAMLGKNPRNAERVISAVKNLISEEINMIRSQKGCVSLYPKSIMELVFSEACRYAIKFGDRLSQTECVELIKALSKCKTPFQCAHGRPVMAVLMDIKQEKRNYPINMAKLKHLQSILVN